MKSIAPSGYKGEGNSVLLIRAFMVLFFSLFLLIFLSAMDTDAQAEEVYRYPDIKTEFGLKAGYRFVDLSGSERAAEYEYLENSAPIWGKVVAFPFPHRVHLEAEALNVKDYFVDARYAYEDTVLSRWLNRTYFHNLDRFSVDVPLDSASGDYNIKAGHNDVFLRLKAHNFPLHLYIDSQFISREGTSQQRFLGGSGWWSNAWQRTSKGRDLDWDSRDVTVGANSHLGPVEVDLSHTEKRFEADADGVLVDEYTAALGFYPPFSAIRPSGVYPHNLIPDTKGSDTTLKVHTSYTGRVVGSVTLARGERENELSGAALSYFTGAAELMCMPLRKNSDLKLFFKYRRQDNDVDNPGSLDDGYYGLSSNPTAFADIKPSISSEKDVLSGDIRYTFRQKKKELTIDLGYLRESIKREDIERWDNPDGNELPEESKKGVLTLSANAKLPLALNIKARYNMLKAESPAYYTEPETANRGLLSLKWKPVENFTALVTYDLSLEGRDDLQFGGEYSDRDVKKDRVVGSLAFLVKKGLTLTTSYAYLHRKTDQRLFNVDGATWAPIAEGSTYESSANNISASLNYCLKEQESEKAQVTAEVSKTTGNGDFSGSDVLFQTAYPGIEIDETVYSIKGERWLKKGWGVGLGYKRIDFQSLTDNPEVSDGDVNIALFTAMKRWK